jgi:hypothetical protein
LNSLQKKGFLFWYDDGVDSGAPGEAYIAAHIKDCGYLLAFISKEYAESDECIRELRCAIGQKYPILLVRLDEHKMEPDLEEQLCSYQAVNAYENNDTDIIEKIVTAEGIENCKADSKAAVKYSFKMNFTLLKKAIKSLRDLKSE